MIATAAATSLASACTVAALVVVFAGPCFDLLLGDRDYSTLVTVTALDASSRACWRNSSGR